jgi:antirestriction protein ArdC
MAERVNLGDVYARVTAKIVADLEAGTAPWHRPWSAGHTEGRIVRPIRHDGTPYRGINTIMLWAEAQAKGYARSQWMTFQQAKTLGGSVRKGEHGTLVVFASSFVKTETNDAGEDNDRTIPFLKGYTVFNVEQCDGLPPRFGDAPVAPSVPIGERIAAVEAFVEATGADVRHGGGRAYYATHQDFIQMPAFEIFEDPESYAATKLHELVHWSGHESREARVFGKRWGDEFYAGEELVAEVGAALLCADLGVAAEPRADHASYLASWLKVLKADSRAIFGAARSDIKSLHKCGGFSFRNETNLRNTSKCFRPLGDALSRTIVRLRRSCQRHA